MEALAVLSRMRSVGVTPNTVSYLSAISACAKVAEWEEALRLLEEMIANGIQPDLKWALGCWDLIYGIVIITVYNIIIVTVLILLRSIIYF